MEEKMKPYPATVNDEVVYGHAKAVAKSMIGEANVRLAVPPVHGGRGLRLLLAADPGGLLQRRRPQRRDGEDPPRALAAPRHRRGRAPHRSRAPRRRGDRVSEQTGVCAKAKLQLAVYSHPSPDACIFLYVYSADHSMHHKFTRACIAE